MRSVSYIPARFLMLLYSAAVACGAEFLFFLFPNLTLTINMLGLIALCGIRAISQPEDGTCLIRND